MTRSGIMLAVCAMIMLLPIGMVFAHDWDKLLREYAENVEKAVYEHVKKELDDGKSEEEINKRLRSAVDTAANKEMDRITEQTKTADGKMPAKLGDMIFGRVFERAKIKARREGAGRAFREYYVKNWKETEPRKELVDPGRNEREIVSEIRKTSIFDDFKELEKLKYEKPVILFFFVNPSRERKIWLQAEDCLEVQEKIFAEPGFYEASLKFNRFRVDIEKLGKPLLRKYKVRSAPLTIFFDCAGKNIYSFDDAKENMDRLLKKMEDIVEKSIKISEKEKPKEPEVKEVPEPEDGKLFNGKNLDGFEAVSGIFKVLKSRIVTSQTERDNPAYLLWLKPLKGDFTFSMKMTIDRKHGQNTSFGGGKAPYGAGIVIADGEDKSKWVKFWTEAARGEKGRMGLSGGRFGNSTSRTAKAEWNDLKLLVKNNILKTYFNGEEINSEDFTSYKGGKIGVFAHMCDVSFKDMVLVREEPKSAGDTDKETPEATAEEEKKQAPREEPVSKKILEKLAQIAPEGYVAVPAGEFFMGAEVDYPQVRENQMPQHKVYLDAYFIKKFEVANTEYKEYIDHSGAPAPFSDQPYTSAWNWKDGQYPEGKATYPVVLVTWKECMNYAKWYGEKKGRKCNLPTEAQWEKAATWNFVKGEKYIYPWGNEISDTEQIKKIQEYTQVTPVGSNSYDVSFCGCYDMFGDAIEFCSDVYEKDYYKNSPYKNPTGGRSSDLERDRASHRGGRHYGLFGRGSSGPCGSWRGTLNGFRLVLEPTEKELFLIKKIVESKGDFDVDAYIEEDKKKKLAEFEKHFFKGKVKKKKGIVEIEYSFRNQDEISDWVFAKDLLKPYELSGDPGMWDVLKSERSLSGGGKVAAFTNAVFTGEAAFDVELKMKNVKNLVLLVSSSSSEDACAACFAIDKDNDIFTNDHTKDLVSEGYVNLIYQLKAGGYSEGMMSCSGNQLTIKDGKARVNGELRIIFNPATSDIMALVSANLLAVGGKPLGNAPRRKFKPKKKYKFTVKVTEGFVLFYVERDLLGFTIAPKGSYRFGVAAVESFVDMQKVRITGRLDEKWMEKEAEK